jgi:hypothetical protein
MFVKIFSTMLCLILTVSCESGNFLEEYSQTSSDEALYIEAKKKINEFQWDEAIEILTNQLSASYQAKTQVKETLMQAYGGQCGISFFDFVEGLKSATSTKMFEMVMQIFAGRAVNSTACDNSLAVLHSLGGTAATRTNSQNLYAAILGLTRMATTLRAKFDTDASGLGNGTVDAGWNSCTAASVANRLSDADLDRIVTGVGLVFENLSALGDQLTSGSAGSTFQGAKTICETEITIPNIGNPVDWDPALVGQTWATVLGRPPGYTPTWVDFGLPSDFADALDCLNTYDAQVSAKMRRIFRRMISSTSTGFGTCDIANMSFNFDINTLTAAVTAECCPALAAP